MTTVKSTVNLSKDLLEQVKTLVSEHEFSSMTEAINLGLALLIKQKSKESYMQQMILAKNDSAYMSRTIGSQTDFNDIDDEAFGQW